MAKELYKRVSPHLQRVLVDGGTTTSNMNDLLLLQRSNEQYKDYLKLSFCPELHGYKKDTRSGINYVTKGYSANSIQQELGPNLILNSGFDTDTIWTKQIGWSINNGVAIRTSDNNTSWIYQSVLTIGKLYKASFTITSYNSGRICIVAGGARGTYRNSIGTYTEYIYCISAAFAGLVCETNDNFVGSIDNVTFQEVLYNDLTQTSSANQPYLDKIAPAEKLSAKNNYRDYQRSFDHLPIIFTSTYKWSIEIVLNWDGQPISEICGSGSPKTFIRFNNGYLRFINTASLGSPGIVPIYKLAGKSSHLTFVANGNSTFDIYINGVFSETINVDTTANFYKLFFAADGLNFFTGNIYSYHIFSKALSASEIAERSAILRSIFPEIPFTRIGDQIWSVRNFEATVTPQGNLIPEVQSNGNVEKIVNGGFNTDTDWSKDSTWSISGGKAICTNGVYPNAIYENGKLTTGKYYKCTFTIDSISGGSIGIAQGGYSIGGENTIGTKTIYFQALNSQIGIRVIDGNVTTIIDNVSFQEIGWSGSQELYDGIYAKTAEAASSVEKITNGVALVDSNGDNLPDGFSSWGIPNLSIVTGNGFSGRAVRMINNTGIQSITTLNSNRYYKVSFEYRGNGARIAIGGGNDIQLPVNTGDAIKYTVYSKGGLGYGLYLVDSAVDLWAEYGNISVKELGLSDATSIANYTYAAVKAAAMWCHYNNDPALGAVYGKLYNWFAVKLLQMDIDYYNANNPTTPWGWRVPTQSDFNTLATTLGGASVAGGKMKTVGTTYWGSPNTGANNSSGFSAIGNGFRIYSSGSYNSLQNDSWTWLIDMNGYNTPFNNSNCNISNFSGSSQLGYGFSLRLIKA